MIKDTLVRVWKLFKEAFKEWNAPNPFRLSAILSYYAIIAMPGLVLIIINVLGLVFDEAGVQQEIEERLTDIIGSNAAALVDAIVKQAVHSEDTLVETIFGVVTLIYGTTGVFFHLQLSFNDIWGVTRKPDAGIKKIALDRVFSFGMVIVIALLFFVSVVLSTVLRILRNWFLEILPPESIYLFVLANWALTFFIIIVLFTVMFKYLPDVKVKWQSAFWGGIVSAGLFKLSDYLIGYYFKNFDIGSVYGAAGFLVIIMFWITYNGLILFYGAAFSKVYTISHHYEIKPSWLAEKKAGQ